MDGTFVEEMRKTIEECKNAGKIIEKDGRTYLYGSFKDITQLTPKQKLEGVELRDLTSLAAIINKEVDMFANELFIKINSANNVRVISTLDEKYERISPYYADCEPLRLRVGQWQDYESFVIGLRANFVQTEERDKLISMIAGICNADSEEMSDNGITQTVATRRGTYTSNQDVKSIIKLKPYRTFAECEQPESEFLFRIRQGGREFALFEADGGKWELDAKKAIKDFLSKEIKSDKVTILM